MKHDDIARQLLVVTWHVLTEHATDQHADPDMVAFKLMTWSWKLTPEQRSGLTTRQFVRYQRLSPQQHDLRHMTRLRASELHRERLSAVRQDALSSNEGAPPVGGNLLSH